MRKALLFCIGALLPAGGTLADEAQSGVADGRHAADGVWYAVYTNYVRSRSGLAPPMSSGRGSYPDLSMRNEPIFYVLTLDVRGTEVAGEMTAGLGVRYEDPQEAMKRLLGVSLEEPRPPPSRMLEGAVEDLQIVLEAQGVTRRLEHGAVIAAEVDGDRMRARVELPGGDVRLVRFDRCTVDALVGESTSGEASSVDPAAYCTVDAIWQRLAEEHGLPVDPNRRSRSRRR